MELKGVFRAIVKVVSEKSPEILTGLGIGGMAASVVLAVKATPKAEKKIVEAKRQKQSTHLTVGETVKVAGPCYILPALTFVAAAACEIGAVVELKHQNATLAAIASIAETSKELYKDAAKDILGEDKEKEIQKRADEKQVEKYKPAVTEPACVERLTDGKVYAYFPVRPYRKFVTTVDKLKEAKNYINAQFAESMDPYENLNDYFAAADIPIWTSEENRYGESMSGETLGFNRDAGFIQLDIQPTDFLATFNDTGTSCTVPGVIVNFVGQNVPKYDYKF